MKRSSNSGQAALILIMIMSVIGAVSVGVASRSVENLRSSEIESTSTQSFKAAESALELALQTKTNVSTADYSATYSSSGTDGFVADAVEEGDVVQVSLSGASAGLTGLKIYWNSDAAIKTAVLNGNGVTGVYSVSYSTADPNVGRVTTDKFSVPGAGGTFKSVPFTNTITIPINMIANPAPQLVRVLVLYQGSSIGVEPVGGILASQTLTVDAVGTAQNNVATNLILSKFSDRVPMVFDNVLFTNGSLSQ